MPLYRLGCWSWRSQVDKPKEATSSLSSLVPGQSLTTGENNTHELAVPREPLLFVEADESGGCSIDGVITSHLDLHRRSIASVRIQIRGQGGTYVLAGMEGRASLANDDIPRDYRLVCINMSMAATTVI
jgi:hypothetical protein